MPSINGEFNSSPKEVIIEDPALSAPFIPFSKKFHCFAGEHWFYANRKAAKHLLEFHHSKPALKAHYKMLDDKNISPEAPQHKALNVDTIVPEESYYHTIFCNAPHLKVSQNHWRYIDWSTGGNHPKTLALDDLQKIQASSAHFARKFDLHTNAKILDKLDAVIA